VSAEQIKELHKKEQEEKEAQEKLRRKVLMDRGFTVEPLDLGET
jgi:hypothetical protein